MQGISQIDGDLKALLGSDLSDGEKLTAIAELLGARSAAEAAEVLNKPVRTVERHYANLRKVRKSADTQICGTQNCGTTQISVENHANLRNSGTQICVTPSRARPEYPTRATKELPSEVLSSKDITPLTDPQADQTTPLQTTPPKTQAKRGTRLSNDWQLPDEWREWTEVRCPASSRGTIEREALVFANYWQSSAGAKAVKLDWFKTWQNWCLKAFSTAPVRPPSHQNQSYFERRSSSGPVPYKPKPRGMSDHELELAKERIAEEMWAEEQRYMAEQKAMGSALQ